MYDVCDCNGRDADDGNGDDDVTHGDCNDDNDGYDIFFIYL